MTVPGFAEGGVFDALAVPGMGQMNLSVTTRQQGG